MAVLHGKENIYFVLIAIVSLAIVLKGGPREANRSKNILISNLEY